MRAIVSGVTAGWGIALVTAASLPVGRKRGQGTFQVTLRFEVEASGKLRSASVIKSSGDAAFDAAALQMMSRADPLPVPPKDLIARDGGRFDVPIVFRAKN